MKLLPRFLTLIQQWRPCFADYRTYQRAVGFALSLLVCLGRRTISRAICAQQRQFQSWASDYKLFSLSRWSPRSLFDVVLKLGLSLVSTTQPVVIALDDTITRKTGHRIPNASTLRDPLSPPYHTNLVWALRFIQAVLLICPTDGIGAARAIPIAFNLAPPVAKPKKKKTPTTSVDCNDNASTDRKKVGKKTSDPEWKQYYKTRRQQGLSAQGALLIHDIRSRLDAIAEFAQRTLWVVVDASYCNFTVLKRLAERTVLIGRTRKDIHLSALPEAQTGRGRRRFYGNDLGTPEQMRKDDSIPWCRAAIFAAGRSHQLRYKSVGPVLWRRGAQRIPLRLIIIAPLAYHAHGHRLYRDPAYLLVTDPAADVVQVLQAYFYRWEIEADQKEEKDLLGVGQAQVWSKQAVSHQPAFHVASYAMLLLAAIQCFGLNSTSALPRLPLWRQRKPPTRMSAAQLIARLRSEIDLLDSPQSSPPSRRSTPSTDFPRTLLEKQIGMKIPITMQAILDSAWT
jgi:DDE superfamily endonuclease